MAGGAAGKQKIEIAERRAIALDLRKQGGDYREIAETMREMEGVSPHYNAARACEDVRAELARYMKENQEAAAEIVALQLVRLNALWQICYEKAAAGMLPFVDACFSVHERLIKLAGAEPPARITRTGPAGEIETISAQGFSQGDAAVIFYMPRNGRDEGASATNGNGAGHAELGTGTETVGDDDEYDTIYP